MNELNALIERLYKEGVEDGGLPMQSAMEASALDEGEEPGPTKRLRRVLAEMGEMLTEDDQPDLTEEAPTEEACLRILNHWEAMMKSAEGMRRHMQSLEQDIERMQPWGDFDVMKVEQLAARGCHLQFWRMPIDVLALQAGEPWMTDYNMLVVGNDTEMAYFVTVTMGDEQPAMPSEAWEVEMCPCPVSTLIMLQTRDKDSLRRLQTLMGDYALVHYGEVYTALRKALPDGTAMPEYTPGHTGLRYKLRQLFKKITS